MHVRMTDTRPFSLSPNAQRAHKRAPGMRICKVLDPPPSLLGIMSCTAKNFIERLQATFGMEVQEFGVEAYTPPTQVDS